MMIPPLESDTTGCDNISKTLVKVRVTSKFKRLQLRPCADVCKRWQYFFMRCSYSLQGFPQDKIIAGCSVLIAGHMAISGLIFVIF